jgi:Cdc6-like AAA superfamily ATPase
MLRKYEIVAILAVMVEKSRNALGKAAASRLYDQFLSMSHFKNPKEYLELSEIEFKEILLRLISFGLINFSNEGSVSYIDLKVYEDEIHAAYEQHPIFKMNETVANNVIEK